MIPLRLQLKNFLSYGPDIQTIDFSTYPLICLSGKNGHGKSALLDAMTWALWGQARKVSATSKADAGLVRLGQTQMMVILDFECNGQCYRVKREYMITYGKPLATLEFGLYNQETLIPLTDKTIRKTQAKIEQTIHLDFASFTNSAFLRQGQSNEFSKKSPKERKEILATILGLDQYEVVKKLALEKVKEASSEQQLMYALQEKYSTELDKKEQLATAHHEIQKKLDALQEQEAVLEKQQASITQKRQKLAQEQEQYTRLTLTLEQLKTKEAELQKELDTTVTQWREVHKKQLSISNTDKLKQEKERLLKHHDIYQKKLQEYLHTKEEYLHQRDQLHQIKQTVEQQHHARITKQTLEKERVEHTYQQLQTECNNLAIQQKQLEQESQKFTHDLKKLEQDLKKDVQTSLKAAAAHFEKKKERYHALSAEYTTITTELDTLQHKKQFIHASTNPSCPLCEQNLSASRKRFLQNKFDETERTAIDKQKVLQQKLTTLKQELTVDQAALEQLRAEGEQQATQKAYAQQCTQQYQQCQERLKQLNQQKDVIQKKLAACLEQKEMIKKQTCLDIEQLLAQNKEYSNQKKKLEELIQKIHTNGYDQKAHEALKLEIAELEKQLALSEQIQHELHEQKKRKETASALCTSLRTLKKELEGVTETLLTYTHVPHRKKELEHETAALAEQYKQIHTTKNQVLQEKGKVDNQQDALAQLVQECKKQHARIAALESIKKDYQTVAVATGKDGIQALLIEQVIPEIEQEANEILAKLTDNQTHIMFESLRDLKKGGTKETLDIKISDASGIRPYELFSGGEAFRIDFALRIAISKLLARRSGTALQTLIIDEGFGSQDEEGLAHIMEAIYKIQDDFSKVIIVSHLTTMKNQFPVHFVVNKDPDGSHVRIVEQG